MDCPVCKNRELMMTERQGIEIDYCPQCRGVWLDRGELDKIIERSQSEASPAPPQSQGGPAVGGDYSHGYSEPSPSHRKKKRKSILSEIFDF
ncbi:TFIIB-type zinc ribbon-containing protein [Gilvimarinus sp. F26214L]|uniref:TFIIB-type zinc ribbon-containing protein n=1 Tax=Gilvimarinus sp. DZF01 TaxID=3461371 RepID=UPI00404618B5